jgi:hypothetical protein
LGNKKGQIEDRRWENRGNKTIVFIRHTVTLPIAK